MKEKPRLIKRKQPLPHFDQPTLNDLIAKFKDDLIRVQREALEKEDTKEDSPLNELVNEEDVQDIRSTVRFKARRDYVRSFYNRLDEFRLYLKKNFGKEITSRTLWEPPKWLTQHRVWRRLEKGRFRDVYGYLHDHCILKRRDKATKGIIGWVGGRVIEEDSSPKGQVQDAILKKTDLEEMKKELGMSKRGFEKYLQAFVRAGILKRIGKLQHGEIVYSIGEYRGYWDPRKQEGGYKLFLYLKNDKAIIEGLEKMKLPRGTETPVINEGRK